MLNVVDVEGGEQKGGGGASEPNSDPNPNRSSGSQPDPTGGGGISIVISQAEEKGAVSEADAAVRKGFLPRDDSYHEQCR